MGQERALAAEAGLAAKKQDAIPDAANDRNATFLKTGLLLHVGEPVTTLHHVKETGALTPVPSDASALTPVPSDAPVSPEDSQTGEPCESIQLRRSFGPRTSSRGTRLSQTDEPIKMEEQATDLKVRLREGQKALDARLAEYKRHATNARR